nr:PREDICTED: coiled-coil domain-containing protein 120 [Lepisosteus oculatus]
MATSPNHCGTHDLYCKVSVRLAGGESGRASQESRDMEVKGHLITSMGLGAPDSQLSEQGGKHLAERIAELQERRRSLQSTLNSRLGELRRICLQEAELTGELPSEYPLEAGERPPLVRRRVGAAHRGSAPASVSIKGEEGGVPHRLAGSGDPGSEPRRKKKPVLSGALRRPMDAEQLPPQNKRAAGRSCLALTDEAVKSESSSMSDSTGHDSEEAPSGMRQPPPGAALERLSPPPPRSRLAPGSPKGGLTRKLSPVEIYYEMKTRRNSVASSSSPGCSLPRSVSNVEGRSVPATPLLSRNAPHPAQGRPEVSGGGVGGRQWLDSPDGPRPPLPPPPPPEGSFDRGGCPYSGVGGMPSRGGPYKSSETLTDGKLRQPYRGSPERHAHAHANGHLELGRVRVSVGGRGGGGGGYNEILLDYIWEKQQQQQQLQGVGSTRPWRAEVIPSSAGAPYGPGSPLMLRGKPGEPRRVRVTRTKSCGPFIPLQQPQQETLLLSTFSESPTVLSAPYPSASASPGAPYPYPYISEPPPRRPLPHPPEDATRSLHKALALEGLRDWYLRNALGHPPAPPRNRRAAPGHGHALQPCAPEPTYPQCHSTQLPQSATFHGHPLQGRPLELSLYQEPLESQLQELSLREQGADPPPPGTLV